MTAPPDRIRAWVWDLPYPSKAQGKAEWSAAIYPAEQNYAEYVLLDLHTAAIAAAEARGREQVLSAAVVTPEITPTAFHELMRRVKAMIPAPPPADGRDT